MRVKTDACVDDIREALEKQPPVLTLNQASAAIGVSTATMRRWIADGRVRAMKTTAKPGGRFRIMRGELLRLIERMVGQE